MRKKEVLYSVTRKSNEYEYCTLIPVEYNAVRTQVVLLVVKRKAKRNGWCYVLVLVVKITGPINDTVLIVQERRGLNRSRRIIANAQKVIYSCITLL